MKFTEEMINEDEKRWHARDIATELGYCGNYMRDRKDMKNIDIRFYAYIMRKAYYMLKKQETKQVELYGEEDWLGLVCVCPDCEAEWMGDESETHFYPNCGRPVKRDD